MSEVSPLESEYLTVEEYAESRKLNRVTVYRLIADGRIRAHHYGRAIRIPADAVPEGDQS